ncbi:hypothetical protein EIP91_007415 [Steccherinum ochraceum]|uniref:RING-type domain-containing protein n=1 Tax=Steccherinum ochraceum TaxID=92696 RepID=A0A4R0RT10_9APHY|nr:hypothetical protein EIP91_007415 [Steccherinum ochraceum]
MASRIHCHVCFDSYDLSGIRVFPLCGHGTCIACLDEIISFNSKQGIQKPPCPVCRKAFEPSKTIQLFLQPPDVSSQSQADAPKEDPETKLRDYSKVLKVLMTHVAAGVKEINEDTERRSMMRMGREVKRVVISMYAERGEKDEVQTLLLELAHFTERISAAFFTQATQSARLSEHLDAIKTQLKDSKTARNSLQDALTQSEKVCKEAIETAERSERMLSMEQKESTRLGTQLKEVTALAEQRYDLIARHKDKEMTLREKIHELVKDVSHRDDEIKDLRGRLDGLESMYAAENSQSQDDEKMWEDGLNDDDLDHIFDIVENSSEAEYDFGAPSVPQRPSISKPASHRSVSVTKPSFAGDWTLPASKKRRVSLRAEIDLDAEDDDPNASLFHKTLGLDRDGRSVSGALQLGDRSKRRFV